VLLNLLGELLYELGELDRAEERFRKVIELNGSNLLTAKFNLARVHIQNGNRDSADSILSDIRDTYQTQQSLSSQDLFAIANAYRHLGSADPQLFKDAVRILDQSSHRDPANLDLRITMGELLLEKYNNKEASEVFAQVLKQDDKHPRALLGLARSQHFDYSSMAMHTVNRALEFNSSLVPARVFLSRLHIELENYAAAEKEAKRALEVNPVSLEALTMLAAVHHLQRDKIQFDRVVKQILALNSNYADLYTSLADLAAQNRLYFDAERFSKQAVALDSKSWRAWGLLGMNQLRLGRVEEGRASLDRSFKGDPYNIWIKNTLELADTFKDYANIERGNFLVVVHHKEKALLNEYVHDLAAKAYEHFKKRYLFEPKDPIRLEFYPDHADFSVRSVGLAGVGLLGVCFGPVVAMDSPAARQRGQFNWGSTLWHEIAHVFHLSMTDNRVPRWFSEGLAVYEEQTAGNGWGGDVTPDFLMAYIEGRLLPVSELNNGFVRPSYPEQVIFSYFQASLVFEFIDKRWGFSAIRKMLNAFNNSRDHNEVLANVLKLDPKSFDTEFDNFFKHKYAVALKSLQKEDEQTPVASFRFPVESAEQSTTVPDKYMDQYQIGALLFEKEDLAAAEKFFKRAQQLFPEYAGNDSSYWILAEIYKRQGKRELAEAQLEKMTAINAEHYQAHVDLAMLRAELGDTAGAAEALERAIYIFPYDIELHQRLASLRADLAQWEMVARERRAVLALDPVDKAEAHYQLANAYHKAGNRLSARSEILYSLEIAPNYFQAQELLLLLRGPGSKHAGRK